MLNVITMLEDSSNADLVNKLCAYYSEEELRSLPAEQLEELCSDLS